MEREKSSPTAESPQRPIIGSSPRTGRFPSGMRHPDYQHSLSPDMVGKQYGWVKIISTAIQRRGVFIHWDVQCTGCGTRKWINKANLTSGKTSGCQACSQPKDKVYETLGRRYDAIYARCRNPKHKLFKGYGGRGIELRFASRREFCTWVRTNLPHPTYQGVELDRTNNDGHYEPGNLRLATRLMQVCNRRNTVKVSWGGELVPLREFPSPYAPSHTYRMVKVQGLSGEEIIEKFMTS